MTHDQNIAAVVTYTASASSLAMWSISDIGVIISSTVAVLGFVFQLYLGFRRRR